MQGQRGAGAAAEKLPGSAETVVPARRLGRRSVKPSPPLGGRPSIVLLGGRRAELLRLGPRGSPGRRTVRAQLSWRSWGKFCELGRGRGRGAGSAGPLPLRPRLGAGAGQGAGPRGEEGAGGDERTVGSDPRLRGPPVLPRRPLAHCLLPGRGAPPSSHRPAEGGRGRGRRAQRDGPLAPRRVPPALGAGEQVPRTRGSRSPRTHATVNTPGRAGLRGAPPASGPRRWRGPAQGPGSGLSSPPSSSAAILRALTKHLFLAY